MRPRAQSEHRLWTRIRIRGQILNARLEFGEYCEYLSTASRDYNDEYSRICKSPSDQLRAELRVRLDVGVGVRLGIGR